MAFDYAPVPADDVVCAWITGRSYDPQARMAAILLEKAHTPGTWAYMGNDGPYRHEGRPCTRCGRVAKMGMRHGYPADPEHYHMAIWGAALREQCSGPSGGD